MWLTSNVIFYRLPTTVVSSKCVARDVCHKSVTKP